MYYTYWVFKIAEENWSADQYFLDNIQRCIGIYIEALMNDNLRGMYDIVEVLETLTSPAIDNDEVENNLIEVDKILPYCFIIDDKGKNIGEYPTNIRQAKKKVKESFRLILLKLEEKGIYRHKAKDPRHAMSNFGSS